jgi:hypothetical protein
MPRRPARFDENKQIRKAEFEGQPFATDLEPDRGFANPGPDQPAGGSYAEPEKI